MRKADAAARLAGDVSIEMMPRAVAAMPAPPAGLPAGCSVYLPFLPGAAAPAQVALTMAAVDRLRDWGMSPVPHLAARAAPDSGWLDAWLAMLAARGVDRLMLVGGDRDRPAGPYADVPALLAGGVVLRHGFMELGVTGYPDGHPQAGPDALQAALAAKLDYAAATGSRLWMVGQFAFETAPVAAWLDAHAALGHGLPMRIGLPGPAGMRTLLRFALQCGVAASARGLRRGPVRRLAGHWSPQAMADGLLAHCRARPDLPVAGLHLFPFGGVGQSLDWLAAWRAAEQMRAAGAGGGS